MNIVAGPACAWRQWGFLELLGMRRAWIHGEDVGQRQDGGWEERDDPWDRLAS